MKLAVVGAVLVSLAVPHLLPSHDGTRDASKPSIEVLLPRRDFGPVAGATCQAHRPGLYGFFNGKAPGRHDPSVDIVGLCAGYVAAKPAFIARLEGLLPCGPVPDGIVVCSPSKPAFDATNELLLVAFQVRAPVPTQIPKDYTARYSLFVDGGGDLHTKSQATATSPDVASQGTNLTYQVVFNDPGTSVVASVDLLAVDRRKGGEFIPSTARIWVHGSVVTFVVPGSEIGPIKGVRAGAFRGSRAAQGDAALGDEVVAPGGVHAPFGLLHYAKTLS